jgi:hypothetical protein
VGSVPLRPFGHDSLEEHAVRYMMQRAIFGAKGNRSVAEVFDEARYSIHRDLVPCLYVVALHIATGGDVPRQRSEPDAQRERDHEPHGPKEHGS